MWRALLTYVGLSLDVYRSLKTQLYRWIYIRVHTHAYTHTQKKKTNTFCRPLQKKDTYIESIISILWESYKGKVIFRKRATNCRSLLRKITYKDSQSIVYITEWWRPIGCLIFIGHFLQKSPIIRGSFAKNVLQIQASYGSSPLCTWLYG